MGGGEIATVVVLTRGAQRSVDSLKRAVRAQRLRFELREQSGIVPGIPHHSLIGRGSQRPSKVFRAGRSVMETAARPSSIQFGPDAPKRHPMLPTESLQGLGCAQCGGGITAQGSETGCPEG